MNKLLVIVTVLSELIYFVTLITRCQAKFGVILNYDNLKLLQLDIGLLRVL